MLVVLGLKLYIDAVLPKAACAAAPVAPRSGLCLCSHERGSSRHRARSGEAALEMYRKADWKLLWFAFVFNLKSVFWS